MVGVQIGIIDIAMRYFGYRPQLGGRGGFTLIEALVAMGAIGVLCGSLTLAYLGVKSIQRMTLHRFQALQLARSQMELLKATPFVNIVNSTQNNMSFDAGPDGNYGTTDDLKGTLTVQVQDWLDMDNDCASNSVNCRTETSIDIDGDGVNDPAAAKPVRVLFTWTEKLLGQSRTMTVFMDSLIAA